MTMEYRLMNADEMERVFDLWVEVYPETERANWKQEFLSIPGSREQTYVAVDGGRVLSTALLWIREMNDSAGAARRVGNVSHVATHPGARRQGHAQKLLGLALETMQESNCDISTLFASEDAKPLYEKLGWQTCPLPFWQGQLMNVDLPRSADYFIRPSHQLDEPQLWDVLSEIYTEFNRGRPLAIRRDLSMWKSFTAHKITAWVHAGASLWLAYATRAPEAICGYLIAHRGDYGFLLAEIGVREQHRSALPHLFYEVTGSYPGAQGVGGRLYLPEEPDIRKLLHQYFQPLTKMESNELMVRAIAQGRDLEEWIVTGSQQAGMFWLLDQV